MKNSEAAISSGRREHKVWVLVGGALKLLGVGRVTNLGVLFLVGGVVPHDMICYFHLPIDPSHCAKF